MKNLKRLISAAVACTLTACSCFYLTDSSKHDNTSLLTATAANSYNSQCKEMLDLINKYRAENGVQPLKLYITGCAAANVRSEELTEQFSHTRPNGAEFHTVLDNYAFNWSRAGENIAMGYPDVESVMSAWMSSSGHKANILDPSYQWVGIGIVDGIYWTQIFLGGVTSNGTLGNPSGDGAIDAIDASLVLQHYAYQAVAPHFEQTDQFKTASDVDKNGTVDALDASEILTYYAKKATGGNPSLG